MGTASAPGTVGDLATNWTVTFKAPTASNAVSGNYSSPLVRCDNNLPGVTLPGCVVPGITPSLAYPSADGAGYEEFTDHITQAQQSGLPGGSAVSPLHRLTDSTLINANRNKACPSSYPRPEGKDCDEYPFASTYEGAYTGGGTARTFPWCQITLAGTPSTGPTGYSVCMIDASENRSAGSVMNSSLFRPYRVLDGDAFIISTY